MRQIKYNGTVIHGDYYNEYFATSANLTHEVNAAGELSFTLPITNPFAGNMMMFSKKKEVTVEIDGIELFRGRLVSQQQNLDGSWDYTAEGQLAYLNDVILPEYGTYESEDWETVAPRNAQQLFLWYVEQFNNVSTDDLFWVNANECSGELTRSSTQRPTVREEIDNKICDLLGCQLVARYLEGKRWLYLYSQGRKGIVHDVEFGENLKTLTLDTAYEELFTAVMAESEDADENKISLADYGDGEYGGYQLKDGILYDEEAVLKYGVIQKLINPEVITDDGLLKNAISALNEATDIIESIECTAVDIRELPEQPIQVLDWAHVVCKPHGISKDMICNKATYDLLNPANDEYCFGAEQIALTRDDKIQNFKSVNQTEEIIFQQIENASNVVVAQTTATAAQTTANTANTNATQAISDASDAQDAADAAQEDATQALSDAADAATTATAYIEEDSSGNVQLGKKSGSTWSTARAKVSDSSFDVVDEDGNILSSFGANSVQLGQRSNSATITLGNDFGTISKHTDGGFDVLSDDNSVIGTSYYFGVEEGVIAGHSTAITKTSGSEEISSSTYAAYTTGSTSTSKAAAITCYADSSESSIELIANKVSINGIKFYTGTLTKTVSGTDSALVWTNAQFLAAFGHEINGSTFVEFCNGDGLACSAHVESATLFTGDSVYAVFNSSFTGTVRLNYLVAVW